MCSTTYTYFLLNIVEITKYTQWNDGGIPDENSSEKIPTNR